MKLGIDLLACETDSRDRGIGRYALNFTEQIAAQCKGNDDQLIYILDSAVPSRVTDARRRLRHLGLDQSTATFGYLHRSERTDCHPTLELAAGMLKSNSVINLELDALLVTTFFETGSAFSTSYEMDRLNGVCKAVIAYDLIPLLFPEKYLPEGSFISDWYRTKLEEFRKFDLYLAISEATKSDLIELAGIPESKIIMIGTGLDTKFNGDRASNSKIEEQRLRDLGVSKPFVLTVGNADWRKNCIASLHAFAGLPEELIRNHQLVFTRVGDDVIEALNGQYRHLADRIVILGGVSEETLDLLYKNCAVFLFPSLYEGFGLPVLEAMSLGAPVLSSSAGALTEVVLDEGTLFDPTDLSDATIKLRDILAAPGHRDAVSRKNIDHAQTFTWEIVAERALRAVRDFVENNATQQPVAARDEDRDVKLLADAYPSVQPELADKMLLDALCRIRQGSKRRILVDISEVVNMDARTGIQRVVRNYLVELHKLSKQTGAFEVEAVQWTPERLLHPREFCRTKLGLDMPGSDDNVDVLPNDIAFMLDSSWLSPERFDSYHDSVRKNGGEVVWMVYDLVPILSPQFCDPGMPPAFSNWLRHAVRNSDGCICISDATKRDLEAFMQGVIPPDQYCPWSRFVHLGSDLDASVEKVATDAALQLTKDLEGTPYFVALSTVEPRKNYDAIISAFEKVWANDENCALIIIGKQGWNVEALATRIRDSKEFGKRLFWLEGIDDGDVQHYLKNATALIQASHAEGYGLAVAEAGSQGIPLILSELPVFREIAGDQANYFTPDNSDELATQIKKALTTRIKPEIALMSWAESARHVACVLLGNSAGKSKRNGCISQRTISELEGVITTNRAEEASPQNIHGNCYSK